MLLQTSQPGTAAPETQDWRGTIEESERGLNQCPEAAPGKGLARTPPAITNNPQRAACTRSTSAAAALPGATDIPRDLSHQGTFSSSSHHC